MGTHSKSFAQTSNMSQTYVLLTIFTVMISVVTAGPASTCAEVRTAYTNMGFSSLDVPTNAVTLKGKSWLGDSALSELSVSAMALSF